MSPPSIILGGGVHGKTRWLIAYYSVLIDNMMMIWYEKLYNHNTPITYCSLHASIALYITHIKFTYTVTRLTSNINEISEVL